MSSRRSRKRARRIILIDLLCFAVITVAVFCLSGFMNLVFAKLGIDYAIEASSDEEPVTAEAHMRETPVPTTEPTPEPTPEPTAEPEETPSPAATKEPAAVITPELTPEPTAEPTPEPTATPIAGLLGNKFAEKFLEEGSEPEVTETAYRSDKIAVEFSTRSGAWCDKCGSFSDTDGTCSLCGANLKKANHEVIYMADVYIRDISCLGTDYVLKETETCRTEKLAKKHNAIMAVNSDYLINPKIAKHGWFVRNSVEIARYTKINNDLCVLYDDGVMETYSCKETIDFDAIWNRYPCQIWYFGPSLLTENGEAKEITHSLSKENPRTVIGYYEPGHYCFLMVMGSRNNGGCRGLTLTELSSYCAELGLTSAYNLDGGDSSVLYFNGVNYGHNGRNVSDIIYIAEPED